MQSFLKNRNLLKDLVLGTSLYLMIKGLIKKTETVTTIELPIVKSETDYKPKYFKETEYFKSDQAYTQLIYHNWLKLAKELDKIRTAFGSPIIIVEGFKKAQNGMSYQGYSNAKSVKIYPQNNDYNDLKKVIQALINQQKLDIESWLMTSDKLIEINMK